MDSRWLRLASISFCFLHSLDSNSRSCDDKVRNCSAFSRVSRATRSSCESLWFVIWSIAPICQGNCKQCYNGLCHIRATMLASIINTAIAIARLQILSNWSTDNQRRTSLFTFTWHCWLISSHAPRNTAGDLPIEIPFDSIYRNDAVLDRTFIWYWLKHLESLCLMRNALLSSK